MNRLYHIVTINLKNKYECNDATYYGPRFDNEFILSSGTPMNPLTVVTVSIIVGKKKSQQLLLA